MGVDLVKRDQIHGECQFSDAEMKLITSKSFERLRYIKQLGFVDLIYPGASHNRYQHSLGVCQCVTDMYNAVIKNCPDFYREGDLELLRMMALVHDLGHSPFSHASEVLSDKTHEERLTDILEYEKKNIILAHDYDIESWDLVNQVYNGDGLTYLSDKHLVSLHNFLDGFIDADKLDYLERDSINCGVGYGRFDRQALINNLVVVKDKRGIDILAVRHEGVQALESFILARYYMFSQVYMHPMERLTRNLFCEEMTRLLPNGKYPDDVKKFLSYDDSKFSHKFKFVENCPYELIYDSEFDENVKHRVDRKLGSMLVCDVARKAVFRKDTDDNTVFVLNSLTGEVVPCSEASPILRGIEYASVHKLRYYAEKSVATELKQELGKVLRCVR